VELLVVACDNNPSLSVIDQLNYEKASCTECTEFHVVYFTRANCTNSNNVHSSANKPI